MFDPIYDRFIYGGTIIILFMFIGVLFKSISKNYDFLKEIMDLNVEQTDRLKEENLKLQKQLQLIAIYMGNITPMLIDKQLTDDKFLPDDFIKLYGIITETKSKVTKSLVDIVNDYGVTKNYLEGDSEVTTEVMTQVKDHSDAHIEEAVTLLINLLNQISDLEISKKNAEKVIPEELDV